MTYDVHTHQPGNQDGDIELTDDGLQEREVARRRGNGGDISVTQGGLGDKTVVYEIENIRSLALSKTKRPGLKALQH